VSQTAELSRVKARIKALTEKTIANGCTEAEAMAAAEMVGRLLERYALSMDAIEIRTARCIQVTVPLGGRRRRPIDGCVPAIARFCDCKVWLARAAAPDPMQQVTAAAGPGRHYVFFGFETDTALVTYLFAVIERAVSRNCHLPAAQSAFAGGAPAAGLGELPARRGGPGIRPPGRHALRPGRDCARTTFNRH
jgi:Protein of unknown function (DUF2786)